MIKEVDSPAKFDLPAFWNSLQDLEDGSIDPVRREELMALLNEEPAARAAYLEYFHQAAVFEIEGAKLEEAGRLPIVNQLGPSRRLFRRSVVAAAILTALLAIVATLIVVKKPEPGVMRAEVAAETRWYVDDVLQGAGEGEYEIVEGSSVRVLSGTLELKLDTGTLLVMQGPARVSFPKLTRPVLKEGWLWVDSSEDEEPFEVEAPEFLIRDIGTRFGVRVPKRGSMEVHLIEGRIHIIDKNNDKKIADLEPMENGVEIGPDNKLIDVGLAHDPFPELSALLAARANYRTTILSQAPASYWRFEQSLPGELPNEVSGGPAAIHGAEVTLGVSGAGSRGGFDGFPERNRGIILTGDSLKSAIVGLGGPEGVLRREGAVSFWFRGDPDDLTKQVLWLAGQGDEGKLEPAKSFLHTCLTESGRIQFFVEDGDTDMLLTSARGVRDGDWHQIVASWGPFSASLFVDGKLVARDQTSRRYRSGILMGRFVRFGKPSVDLRVSGYKPFMGGVDEIALWNRPLTEEEVFHQFDSALGSFRNREVKGDRE